VIPLVDTAQTKGQALKNLPLLIIAGVAELVDAPDLGSGAEGLKRGYAITVTAAELDAKVEEKLKEAQPEVEMKGFRKGKVPMALLRKQFGQRVMGEAMQESIDGAMNDHMETTGDRPAAQPQMKMTDEPRRICAEL